MTNPVETPPIACSLGRDDAIAQVVSWQALSSALRQHNLHPRGATLWFDPRVEDSVRLVSGREAECCAFLTFEHGQDRGLFRVDMSCDVEDGVTVAHMLANEVIAPTTSDAGTCDCC
jgi:hypothetical protein